MQHQQLDSASLAFGPGSAFDPGDEVCPPWWPQLIWDLHYWKIPHVGPNPVNYPPALNDIMASIAIHTLSYLQLDQKAAQEIRTAAEKRIIDTAGKLSKLHDQHT